MKYSRWVSVALRCALAVSMLGGVAMSQTQSTAKPADVYLHRLANAGTRGEMRIYSLGNGNLVEGRDHNLYTTSKYAGVSGRGAIVRVTQTGEFKLISEFDDPVGGTNPEGGLTVGADGDLYGTTAYGGNFKTGTVFKVATTGGKPSVLWHFRNQTLVGPQYSAQEKLDAAGGYPRQPPVLAADGVLYGVTNSSPNKFHNVLYRIDKNGYQALYQFDGSHGTFPATLIAGADGNLYGTTLDSKAGSYPGGSVFVVKGGRSISTLKEFTFKQGVQPTSLLYGSDGNLYGTTARGLVGTGGGRGILYKLALDGSGSFQVLHQFTGGPDGQAPSGVAEGADGYLYGTSRSGPGRAGVLFRIRKDGTGFEVQKNFVASDTGQSPLSQIMRHSNGKFYGTTDLGGVFNRGTVYQVDACPLLVRAEQPDFEGGDLEFSTRWLEVRTHARAKWKGAYPPEVQDSITMKLKCGDRPHLVQFVYREFLVRSTNELQPGKYQLGTREGERTTDLKKPKWSTDSPRVAGLNGKMSPYFEETASTHVDCDSLTVIDAPTFYPDPDDFYIMQRATFETFAMCGGQVVEEFRWSRKIVDGVKSYAVSPPTTRFPDPFQEISDDEGFEPWPQTR